MPRISEVVSASSEAMSIKYNNLVYEMKSRGEKVIVLSLGEAFFDIPLMPMDDLPYPAIYHYSHSRGIPELRDRIAQYYAERYAVAVDPEKELLITAGSKAAIHFSMMATLNPGDEVIVQEPLWVSYPEQARLCHGFPIQIPYTATVRDFEDYITERTRLIIVNNPNNPTGQVFSESEMRYLADLAAANDIYLLSDEAYSDFLVDEGFHSAGRFDSDKSHTIICNSISKNLGISGWRIGYAISNAALINQLLKINQHLITCPATILQYYLARHFDNILNITDPQIRAVVEKRKKVVQYLKKVGLEFLPGNSTFYLFVSIAPSALDSETFCMRLLQEDRVSVVPGIGYGHSCDGFVRLSVGTESLEDIRTGIDRIKALVDCTQMVAR
jgi:aspartate aminotransferase/aminotransferase